MNLKKIFHIMLAVSVLATGCGKEPVVVSQKEQKVISFSWWGNDKRNEYTIEAVKQFEKLHPEIRVNCSYTEWSGYETRSNIRMISDTEADVMQINYAWIQQYSPDGSGYYDINLMKDYIRFENFTEDDLNFGMQNGKLNAVPIALNTQTVYINKTIYDDYGLDIPKTWDDLFEAAKVMNGKNYPISMASKSAWLYIISYAEQQTGKRFMSKDGILEFNADDIKIMLEFYSKLVNENVMPQVEYYDKAKISSGNYAGTVAWLSDGASYFEGAIENGYEYVIADYTSQDPAKSGEGWYSKPATMYAISKNTEYPEESAMLLDYLLNSSEMARLQGLEKGIPISSSARSYLSENNMLEGLQYDAYLKMEDHDDLLLMISPYLENSEIIDEFVVACNSALYNKASPDEQAKLLYDSIKNILK